MVVSGFDVYYATLRISFGFSASMALMSIVKGGKTWPLLPDSFLTKSIIFHSLL